MDNGNWILVVGIIIIFAVMYGNLRYDKWKRTRHLHTYGKKIKYKFTANSENNYDEQTIPTNPPYKIHTTTILTKIIWLIIKPFKIINIFFKWIGNSILSIGAKFSIKNKTLKNKKTYHLKRYGYIFLGIVALAIIIYIPLSLINLAKDNSKNIVSQIKSHHKPTNLTAKDGTNVVLNYQIQQIDSLKIKTTKTPDKKISQPVIAPPKPNPPKKPTMSDDDYLIIF